ncbi:MULTISPECIES: glutathione S-transferase family protein [unclassified Moorena]|uniref:glutathione S-transferase family protein n=1 Tax=unclassified Moorena TaxID=2683338 RepID=UPI0013FE52B4|nr:MULTISPECIES: glutathione S-transferase family protein [unclassified Moorena]NEO13094.1 glutathione S-transferase family protein [Moorena sp. SIO3E8]NEP98112.1 glutathione S-transferase family protein [Moorena sp. SIO3F7]
MSYPSQESEFSSQENFQVSQSSPQLKLYSGLRSRATIVQWYLEELGVPYEYILLDMKAGEHKQPEYLSINPMGKVPAIVDGDFKLWESGAILVYLANKYGETPSSLEEQSEIVQWVLFANATLGLGLFLEDRREKEAPSLLKPLNELLTNKPFLLGDNFSVVDIAVGSYLFYAKILVNFDFKEYPAVADYLMRLSERPAFQQTIGNR